MQDGAFSLITLKHAEHNVFHQVACLYSILQLLKENHADVALRSVFVKTFSLMDAMTSFSFFSLKKEFIHVHYLNNPQRPTLAVIQIISMPNEYSSLLGKTIMIVAGDQRWHQRIFLICCIFTSNQIVGKNGGSHIMVILYHSEDFKKIFIKQSV